MEKILRTFQYLRKRYRLDLKRLFAIAMFLGTGFYWHFLGEYPWIGVFFFVLTAVCIAFGVSSFIVYDHSKNYPTFNRSGEKSTSINKDAFITFDYVQHRLNKGKPVQTKKKKSFVELKVEERRQKMEKYKKNPHDLGYMLDPPANPRLKAVRLAKYVDQVSGRARG